MSLNHKLLISFHMKIFTRFFKSVAWLAAFVLFIANSQIGYSSVPTPDCPSNLLFLLRLDETSGPNYADFYGVNNAVATNSPVAATGIVHGAQQFNTSDYVNIADNGNDFEWAAGCSFSLEFWIKTPLLGTAQVGISRQISNGITWWMGINEYGGAVMEIQDHLGNNYAVYNQNLDVNYYADNQWHHFVGIKDGAANYLRLYVDGVLVREKPAAFYGNFVAPSSTAVSIGYMLRADGASFEYHLQGYLDEVAVYTKALTATEVVSFYNAGLPKGHCNTTPFSTSVPETSATEDIEYSYTYTVDDPDAADILTLSAVSKPSWLNFTWNSGQKSATLSGTPTNANVGSNSVTLRVNDGFTSSDQTFTITVANVNDVPVITGQNPLSVDEDNSKVLTLSDLLITDVDNPSTDLTLSVLAGTNYTFSGNTVTPDVNYNGVLEVNVVVNDLVGQSEEYPVSVTVNSVNDLPEINSTPSETATVGVPYMYQITATDIDQEDILSVTATNIPDWLTFTPGSNSGILMGIPAMENVGTSAIILKVSDSHQEVMQGFIITVTNLIGIENLDKNILSIVYPNPANDKINFRFSQSGSVRIEIYNVSGNLLRVIDSENEDLVENINVSDLSKGMYFYKVYQSDKINNGKIIKE
jgi:VCBS repeat-containing protein